MAFAKLLVNRIRNAEAVAAFSAATCQNLAAIGSLHSVTKTMLVSFLSVRRLECSFHYRRVYLFLFGWRFRTAKLLTFVQFTNLLLLFERNLSFSGQDCASSWQMCSMEHELYGHDFLHHTHKLLCRGNDVHLRGLCLQKPTYEVCLNAECRVWIICGEFNPSLLLLLLLFSAPPWL